MSSKTTFDLWKRAAGPAWHDYTQHKFVQQLKDGTLPEASFVHYLCQDYIFLIHFSRAWALAITKTEHIDEMRFAAITVNGLINEEIALHVKACKEYGFTEEDLIVLEERPENLAYTRYVLNLGHSGDLLDLLAALAPCVLGYGEIGRNLMNEASSETYADWINVYSGAAYQDLCDSVNQLIDLVAQRRIGAHPQQAPRWQSLCKTFTTATKLEVGFWEMGLTP